MIDLLVISQNFSMGIKKKAIQIQTHLTYICNIHKIQT